MPEAALIEKIAHLPTKQQDVLSRIAINEDGGHNRFTLAALERKGLIESYEEVLFGGFLPLRIKRYRVPIPVHMAWCAWCADQPGAD